ncbi:DUF4265 domain-containing protein [Labedaea rhizosphaerae]|uniref:DUF4265 domain-containing protein n=1 Tax=Labedaea rhizosphaerae TaxID=598644 RepID=UPI00105E6F7D|nr:DUF4265 domain-containing protein [Labedaea rhizosphaerae]
MNSENILNPSTGESSTGREQERLFKVAFDLPDGVAEWAGAASERLWTAKTSVRWEVEVRNTPFYIKGVAFGDIVRIRADHERREFVFEEFVSESGHSTVRVVLKSEDAGDRLGALFGVFGCSWEIDRAGILWAIDVPVQVDYSSLRTALLALANEGKIGIEEGALAREHRSEVELPD